MRHADAEVARAAQARSNAIADIDRRHDLNARLIGELLTAQQRLQSVPRTLGNGGRIAEPAGLPLRALRSDLAWPTRGTICRRFARPVPGRTKASNGIEIAAPEGA